MGENRILPLIMPLPARFPGRNITIIPAKITRRQGHNEWQSPILGMGSQILAAAKVVSARDPHDDHRSSRRQAALLGSEQATHCVSGRSVRALRPSEKKIFLENYFLVNFFWKKKFPEILTLRKLGKRNFRKPGVFGNLGKINFKKTWGFRKSGKKKF